jgi:hypothetical protein
VLISSVGVLPSSSAMLYYMLGAELFKSVDGSIV